MSFKLLRQALNGRRPLPRMWRNHDLKDGFYNASVKLYENLAADLDVNVMFSQRGPLTLAAG